MLLLTPLIMERIAMKKSRCTKEQVTYVLCQAEGGRMLKMSDASEVRRLRQLEDENSTLKRLVADLTVDKNI